VAIHSIANEKHLLNKIAEGDQRAFTVLFDFYYKNLRNYIFKITESQEVTEELVQEIFIKVWEKRDLLTEVKCFKSYLFILSRNRALNHLRDASRARVNEMNWLRNQFENSYLIDDLNLQDEYHSIIEKAISDLPPQQQKVYNLSRYEHLKYEEIALRMGLSKETVKKHMQHALAFLKRHVKDRIEEVAVGLLLFILYI